MMFSLLAIDPTAFRVFGWPIQWYGLIIGCGIVVAYVMITTSTKKYHFNEEHVSDIIFWTIIMGLIGARMYYVLFRWDLYSHNLALIPQVWQGGLAIYGGILAGGATLFYLCRRYHIPVGDFLDCTAPDVLLAQAIGRWGNFINQEAYGIQTTHDFLAGLHLPNWIIDQMLIQGAYHHPTFLYESLWSATGVVCLLLLRSRWTQRQSGDIALLYVIWYGFGRMFIESLRTDSLYFGAFRISQVVALSFVLFGTLLFVKRRKKLS